MSDNGNFRNNDLVVRYVYDVTRRLPEKQREDIAQELSGLIEDMILEKLTEEDFGAATRSKEEIIREVLTQMGDPAKLARKYRGEEEHLIGGEYYGIYCLVLKIILLCAGFGYVVASIVSTFVNAIEIDGTISIITEQIEHYCGLPGVLISAFGSVTLIFVFMERAKVKVGDSIKWDISKLPLMPSKKAQIKRSDCIVDIVFEVIFLSVFAFAPSVIGLWIVEDNQTLCIPIFNISIWSSILPIFAVSFVMGIVKDAVKLIEGCYNKIVWITTIITSAVSVICTIAIFKGFELWNPTFVTQVKEVYGVEAFASGDLVIYFGEPWMNTIFMTIVLVGIAIDVIVVTCKSIMNWDNN